MIKKTLLGFFIATYIAIGASFIVANNHSVVFAAEGDACTNTNSFLGLPTWYKYLEQVEDSTGRCSPILSGADVGEKTNSALPIGLAILEGMLRISGIVAVVMVFFAGFKYITSQGNPEAAVAARKTALNALIGLIIVIMATTLVSFVGNSLLPNTPRAPAPSRQGPQ